MVCDQNGAGAVLSNWCRLGEGESKVDENLSEILDDLARGATGDDFGLC
jgi:hypothetical protein